MNGFRLGASVLGVAAVVIFVQPVYAQISAEQRRVEEIAKEVTVYLEVPNSGSGVLIKRVRGNNGDYVYTVLTAYHVVQKLVYEEEYYLTVQKGNRNERKYRLKNISTNLMRRLGNLDLAIAQFTSNERYEVAAIGDSKKLNPNEAIYVAGFPKPSEKIPEIYLRFRIGSVDTMLSQPNAKGYQLVYDNHTFDGMSGGAVLNRKGELMAIHGQGQGENTNGKERNLGIPTALFRDQLDDLLASLDRKPRIVPEPRIVSPKKPIQPVPDNTRVPAPLEPPPGPVKPEIEIPAPEPPPVPPDKKRTSTIVILQPTPQPMKLKIPAPDPVPIRQGMKAEDYFARGLDKYKKSDFRGAIADLNESIRINPNFADAYVGLGKTKFKLGDNQGAIADYTEAIRINPNDNVVYNNRGTAKSNLGDNQGALADYTESIRINPEYAIAYFNRGAAKFALGDKQGAIADFRKAEELFGQQGNSVLQNKVLDNLRKLQASHSFDGNKPHNGNRFTMQGGARSVNWMNANVISTNTKVRFVGLAKIVFADGYKGSFYDNAFAIWGNGGIVIDGSRLTIIPDNSNVCILQNNDAVEDLKTFAELWQRNDQNNLKRLRPKVEQLVPELLRSCRNSRLG